MKKKYYKDLSKTEQKAIESKLLYPKSDKKAFARESCPMDDNNLFYFEYNPDWHGMRVLQRVCAICGMAVVLYQLNESSVFAEEQQIAKELKRRSELH